MRKKIPTIQRSSADVIKVLLNSAEKFLREFCRSEGAAEGGFKGGIPLRPSVPPERSGGGQNFPQNGFALFLEYPTIQNFSTFSLGTRPNARRAERRGSQGIEPKNPTAH